MDDVVSVLMEMLKDYCLEFLANDWVVIPIIATVLAATIILDMKCDEMRARDEELQAEIDLLAYPENEHGGEDSWV